MPSAIASLPSQQQSAIAPPFTKKSDRILTSCQNAIAPPVVFIRLPVVLKLLQYPVRRVEFARFQCSHQAYK